MATDDKYDRQLRLWGPHGQRSLMNAHILLINADGCGTETLKNLVLPGVGKFTILDGNLVTEKDCGSNFFVTESDVGKPRAEVACNLLSELNPDVQGHFRFGGLSAVIEEESATSMFAQFSLIIASNVEESLLVRISRIADELNIPLAAVRAYGLIGSCRLQFKNHEMIETKPSPDLPDLRIANPFEELLAYCSKTLSTKCTICDRSHSEDDVDEHAHHCKLPFPVLLVRAVVKWKASHDNQLPKNAAERSEFQLLLENEVSGAHVGDENFSEALQGIFLALRDRPLPDPILDSQPLHISASPATAFRVLSAATKMFIERSGGIPPLSKNCYECAHFVLLQLNDGTNFVQMDLYQICQQPLIFLCNYKKSLQPKLNKIDPTWQN
jgi:NEDD8-activating enzyme E1 regulatory subunit